MYVGLVDDDLRGRGIKHPNLEIMKLSSYHKKNRDLVELIRDYRAYTRYSKIYFRRDGVGDDLPTLFLSKTRDKCDYGGHAFTNGIYIPMDDAIEKSLPDVTIYDKIKLNNKSNTTYFLRDLNRNHVRLQTNDRIDGPKDSFLVYDKDASQYPLLQEILATGKRIKFVEPQNFDELDKALEFATQPLYYSNTCINYNGKLDLAETKAISNANFKNKIYFKVFPQQYSSVSFIGGLDVINANIGKIEALCRQSPYFAIQPTFVNKELNGIIITLNKKIYDNSFETTLRYFLSEKSYNILAKTYPSLLQRLKSLWGYHNYGK